MRIIITDLQKKEIETLTNNHFDALIAYGADLYHQGMIKGATMAIIGMVTATTVSKVVWKVMKTKKSQQTEEESQ